MSDLKALIGYEFRDPALLEQVFCHRSFRHESSASGGDNERLEFLGDAVLGFVVSRLLYDRFPDRSEGDLSRLRAHVVSATHLAAKSRALGLGAYLRLGRGEDLSGGRDKDSILADAFESLVAGIFLDGGPEAATRFVLAQLEEDVNGADSAVALRDYKSQLQEELHARGKCEPDYSVVAEAGPDHRKMFEIAVTVDGREIARGHGSSKKSAQQAAARSALGALDSAPGEA